MTTPVYDPEDGHRLPATYANFLIINGAVLLPVYNCETDKEAIQTLQVAFPDREIVPIDCSVLIRQHGSLHCVTMQYPAKQNTNSKSQIPKSPTNIKR
jgi:agmatine/peptidylarginine deiminase